MKQPAAVKRPRPARPEAPAAKASWTGALDQAIGRARTARSKLFLFALGYSTFIFLSLFLILNLVFGSAFGEDVAAESWSLGAAFALLLVTSIGSLASLDFFLIRPLRKLEQVNPESSLGAMISSFFDKHAALENRFSRMAVEVKSLSGDREKLTTEVGLLQMRESVATSTLTAMTRLTDELLVVADVNGHIMDMSPPLQKLLGVKPDGAVGRPFTEVVRLFDPDDPRPLECPLPDLVNEAFVQRSPDPGPERAILLGSGDRQRRVTISVATVNGFQGVAGPAVSAIARISPEATGEAGEVAVESDVAEITRPTAEGDFIDTGAFARRAAALVEKGRSGSSGQVVLLASIDGQESVTDRYGHAAGESLMWAIKRLLDAKMPDSGKCFRISGTHFAILLPDTDAKRGASIADDIRVTVDAREFAWREVRYNVTMSIAAVPFGADCEGYPALLEQADRGLVAAKANGGNRVEVVHAGEAQKERRRNDSEWVEWVVHRAQQGRVHLISQEIRPVSKNHKPMLEALVRIEDDDGVWVEPGVFLPALVRRDATAKLDLQVLRHVAATVENQAAKLGEFAAVFVNVSGASIADPRFTRVVCHTLKTAPEAAKRLGFDIDCQFVINDPAAVSRFVKAIKPMGVSVALDRCKSAVGLEVLSKLPIDLVKIDASLIRRATVDALDRSQVEWIQKAVVLLGRKTVAMGVGDDVTLALIRQVGVDYLQGTHLDKLGALIL